MILPGWRGTAALVTLFGVLVLLGACAADQDVRITTTGGANGQVGDIVLRDIKIAYDAPVPGDAVYQPGQSAPLRPTIVNDGERLDRLIGVTSPVAASAVVVGDPTIIQASRRAARRATGGNAHGARSTRGASGWSWRTT